MLLPASHHAHFVGEDGIEPGAPVIPALCPQLNLSDSGVEVHLAGVARRRPEVDDLYVDFPLGLEIDLAWCVPCANLHSLKGIAASPLSKGG